MGCIDGSRLRSIPVEMALKLSATGFAAGQRHSLKNPLVPECRILILLFGRAGALASDFLVCVPVLFNHKDDLNPHREPVSRYYHFFCQAYNKKAVKPIAWLVLARRRTTLHPPTVRTLLEGLNVEKCKDRVRDDERMEPACGLEQLTCVTERNNAPIAVPGKRDKAGEGPSASRSSVIGLYFTGANIASSRSGVVSILSRCG